MQAKRLRWTMTKAIGGRYARGWWPSLFSFLPRVSRFVALNREPIPPFLRKEWKRWREGGRRKTEHHRNSHPGYPPKMVQRHCRGHLDAFFREYTRVHQRIHSNFDLAMCPSMAELRFGRVPALLNLLCSFMVRARSKQQVKFTENARPIVFGFNKAGEKIQKKNIYSWIRALEASGETAHKCINVNLL